MDQPMNLRQFDEVDQGRVNPFRDRTISLETAVSKDRPLELPFSGTFLYFNDDTSGKVYVRFNDMDSARVPCQAGFSVGGFPYRRIFLDWEAQAGKIAVPVYGVGATFNPTNDINNIGSILSPVDVAPVVLPDDFSFHTVQSASGAVQTIVSPAENEKGLLVYGLSIVGWGGKILMKGSVPVGWVDAGSVVLGQSWLGTDASSVGVGELFNGVFSVPAGYGLYQVAYGTQSAYQVSSSIVYKVL